jgi:hypothetical protein
VAEVQPPKGRLALAVTLGLAAALVLGGGGMLWSAWRTTHQPFDCQGLAADDCALEQDIAVAWAKSQNGLGLVVVSLGAAMGLTLWLTERRRRAPPKE